ncbi:MAG: PilN domain-containing protein [Thermoleophilia bacterium]
MKRMNLLPPDARAKASRERGLLYAILVLVAVVVVLGLVYVQQNGQVNDKQSQLDQLNAQIQTVQAQAAALQPYADLQATRTAMTTTARTIYAARVPWSTVLEEVSLVIPENVRLQSLTCAVPAALLPGAAAAPVGAASNDVTFAGTTYSHKDVAEFMTRLGLIPQLTNIQLATSSGSAGSGTTATAPATVAFTVTASLRPYLSAPPPTVLQAGGAP